MLGNSDLKPDQNRVYMLERPHEGARRWYVASDLGHPSAAPGYRARHATTSRCSSRHHSSAASSRGSVRFDYRGLHRALFTRITVADVHWIAAGWRQSATGSGTMPSAPAATRRRPRNATSAACNRRSPKAWRSQLRTRRLARPPSVLKLCGSAIWTTRGGQDTT